MKKNVIVLFALSFTLFFTGCVDISFVGQEFEPLPENKTVSIYRNRQNMPIGKFVAIGKAVITGPRTMDGYDVRDTLISLAKSKGAQAVLIVESNVKTSGLYNSDFEGDHSPDGGKKYSAQDKKFLALGKETTLSKELGLAKKRITKVILYKDKNEVTKELVKLDDNKTKNN